MRRGLVGAALLVAGCGSSGPAALPPSVVPTPVGVGPGYRLGPGHIARAACAPAHARRFGAHVELFARRRVLLIPAGVGWAPPRRRAGRRLVGACSAAVRTAEPTGVVEVAAGSGARLGELFRAWGQPLSAARLGPFRGTVRAWVGGRRWRGAPGAIPLARHAEIVLELGGHIPPHPSYLFPRGL